MIDVRWSILLVAVTAVITFLLRAFPFLVFGGKRQMPEIVKKVADRLPPAIMGVLVIYCLKDFLFVWNTNVIAAFVAVMGVVLLHLWRKNTLLSIAAGTFLYMLLIRIL